MSENLGYVRRKYEMPVGYMSGVHFGPLDAPIQVVLLHANGFHGLAYRRMLEQVGVHCVALDLRGHGATRMPCDIDALESFHGFAQDVADFFKRYIHQPVILVGHSLGGSTGILAVPKIQKSDKPHDLPKIRGFLGLDPASLSGMASLMISRPWGREIIKKHFKLIEKTARRRSIYGSREEAFVRYQNRGAFRGVADDVIKDYIEGGLELRADGQYHLQCDPLWEQAIFVAHKHSLKKAARSLPDISHIIYSGQGAASVSTSSSRRAIQRAQPKITVEFRQSLRHLFPFQDPEIAAAALRDILKLN